MPSFKRPVSLIKTFKKIGLIFVVSIILNSSHSLSAAEKVFDYLIQNAIVFDGQSQADTLQDVAIQGDKIVAIGKLNSQDAKQVIDASGLILSPGFIDAHTHSDLNPVVYTQLSNKVLQGVTTEVVGNCGMSAAPVEGAYGKFVREIWAREGVAIPNVLPWQSFEQYQENLEATGLQNNLVGLVGHGNLRAAVMGMESRAPSVQEMMQMKQWLSEALQQGAKGISFGLAYLPGMFAQEEEIVELCAVAAQDSKVCAFHIRNEGASLIPSLQEAISVGRRTGAKIQISHLKAGGSQAVENIQAAFQLIEAAKREGIKIEADAYPYAAGAAELGVVLPDELYANPNRVALFQDPQKRSALLAQLKSYYHARSMNWDKVMFASSSEPSFRSYEGKTIKQIALARKEEPEQTLIHLLAQSRFEASAFYFSQNENVVKEVMRKPYVMIGSDSIADGTRKPHPRAFGTFPKVLHEFFIREKKMPLSKILQKMTALPADQFGLSDRGRMKVGYSADLVLLNLGKLTDQATYADPKKGNLGIEWVFVNGIPVVAHGQATGQKPGRFLD